MTGIVSFLFNAAISAVSIALYAAWGSPFSLGVGVFAGIMALGIAMRESTR
jgi:hypothetical protein